MYSQNEEEKYILEYFKDQDISQLTALDLGAFDGINLSNTRRLWELGAKSVFVEMSETVFATLRENYKDSNNVILLNYGISSFNGVAMYSDTSEPLSTLVEDETERWKDSGVKYIRKSAKILSVDSLFLILEDQYDITNIDFISIDCEGLDFKILEQIDLLKKQTKLICIEFNGDIELKTKIIEYCSLFGLNKILYENGENLLLGK